MIAFIDDHRQAYGSSRSAGFCRSPRRPITPKPPGEPIPPACPNRVRRDAHLKVEIRRVFEENFRVYGMRKVWGSCGGKLQGRSPYGRPVDADMGLRAAIRGKPCGQRSATRRLSILWITGGRQFHASRLTVCGSRILPMSRPWPASSMSPCHRRLCPANRRLARQPNGARRLRPGRPRHALHDRRPASRGGLVHHSVAPPNMFRSRTPSGSPKPGSSLPWAASATLTNALAETTNGLYKAE